MAKSKRGLGKGLGALIPQEEISIREEVGSVNEIDINEIVPNKDQPRKTFDPTKIDSLAKSIDIHGIVQPIVVKKNTDGNYSIIAGERRWRAAKQCGLIKIPAVVKDVDEKTLSELALVENLQRENLNDIEEALAYKYLKDSFQMTQDQISISVGKSRTYITNMMRLLKLDDQTKDFIENGSISGGHGRALLSISDIAKRIEVLEMIVSDKLSVRQVETIVKGIKSKKGKPKKTLKKEDSNYGHLESYLETYFATKVRIMGNEKKRKIEIELYSDEEFNRILELLNYNE